jgi:hypothetical protein
MSRRGGRRNRELVLRAVIGIGVEDELRVREVLLQDERVHRVDDDVVAAIDDQRRLGDRLQQRPGRLRIFPASRGALHHPVVGRPRDVELGVGGAEQTSDTPCKTAFADARRTRQQQRSDMDPGKPRPPPQHEVVRDVIDRVRHVWKFQPQRGAQSCVLLAALHGHDVAVLTLVQVLRARAVAHDRKGEEALLDGDPAATRAFRRAATLVRRLGSEWSGHLHLSFLAPPRSWQRLFDPPLLTTPDETQPSAPTPVLLADPAMPTRPTLQVIAGIGFPETEDESIASAYQQLTEPLPRPSPASL